MARQWLGLVLGVSVLASAAPVLAHHSVSAEFDTTKTITFTGKVKEVNWGNPHIYTSVETTDPDTGKPVVFRVEGGAPNALFRAGKDFEVLPLSGLTHMVPDPVVTQRLWGRIMKHFQLYLGKPE